MEITRTVFAEGTGVGLVGLSVLVFLETNMTLSLRDRNPGCQLPVHT